MINQMIKTLCRHASRNLINLISHWRCTGKNKWKKKKRPDKNWVGGCGDGDGMGVASSQCGQA